MQGSLKYSNVIFDKIACQSFIDWTYENSDETILGRESLFDLHLLSAQATANTKHPIIILSSVTKSNFENEELNKQKDFLVSSLIEASEHISVP